MDFAWSKVSAKDVTVDEETIPRDVLFFLIFFAVATAVGVVRLPFVVKAAVAVLPVAAYAYYVRRAISSSNSLSAPPELIALWRFGSRPPNVGRRRPARSRTSPDSGRGAGLRRGRGTHVRGRRRTGRPRRPRARADRDSAAGGAELPHSGEGWQVHPGLTAERSRQAAYSKRIWQGIACRQAPEGRPATGRVGRRVRGRARP